ncbi:MAG: HNH endonuclease [Spirochaetia bacterium]|nr:HNH endonuclease [Spirochaetia bacterium]
MRLIFSKKAHTIEEGNTHLCTVRARVRVPSVIQIFYYVKKPYLAPKFSKKSVFIRDNYRCQYCGKHITKPTIDHIIPKSKGGRTGWMNVVTACNLCNNKKGDRPLKEAGMRLIKEPHEPKYLVYSSVISPARMKRWERYFYPELQETEKFIITAAVSQELAVNAEALV